jgi:predicted dehydrogenase
MTASALLRVGLVGTGYWARETHAPAIGGAQQAELVAVWGRDPQATASLAATHGAIPCSDYSDFLRQVDAVAFSVPPDVQDLAAIQAAAAGKHLLLEKPISLDPRRGERLLHAVRDNDVAALVFFTHLFTPAVRDWLSAVVATGPWSGGTAVWLGSALNEENPFNTPWRRVHGGLWDVGPHAVAALWHTLGPVTRVTAESGVNDLTYLVLQHEGGASSSATLTLSAPDAADGFCLQLWGAEGRSELPIEDVDSPQALSIAIDELAAMALSGARTHPSDIGFGYEVLQVLASAQRQLDGERTR